MGNSNKTTTGSSAPKRSATTKGKLSTAAVGKQLGVRVTADRIKALDIVPAIETGRGAYWHPEQVSEIAIKLACDLVDEYIESHEQQHIKAPAAPVQCAEDDPALLAGQLLGHPVRFESREDGTVMVVPTVNFLFVEDWSAHAATDRWLREYAGARFADMPSALCSLLECYLVEREQEKREDYRERDAEAEEARDEIERQLSPWWQRLFRRAAA